MTFRNYFITIMASKNGTRLSWLSNAVTYFGTPPQTGQLANNESSEVIDILLPVTFYVNLSTRLDK